MSTLALTTFRDSVRNLIDYLGGNVTPENVRYSKTAVLNAYREFATAARWTYFYNRGRLNTVASQTAGSVAFTASNNQMVLTGATWPSWAAYGTVRIGNVAYQVVSRDSDTQITLSVNSNPGVDLPSGTAYTIYRDTYPMPLDFVSATEFFTSSNMQFPMFVSVGEWLSLQRTAQGPGTPRHYTFRGDPHYQGVLAVSFFPPPDNIYPYDFIYQRRPRPLLVYDVNAGTVTVASGSQTVVGTGTAWDGSLVGSVIRFSSDGKNPPEGLAWSTPYVRERIVTAVADATHLTVDNVLDLNLTNVLYTISDPVDIEPGAMLTAFLRCCEKQQTLARIMKNMATAEAAYKEALILAREADSRSFTDMAAGEVFRFPSRLAYMPRGADQS